MEEYHEWVNDIRGVTLASLAVSYSSDGGEISLEDTIADKDSVQPQEMMEQAERKELVEKGLNALPCLERNVAKMYFQEGLCLRQIASQLNLHITRVSQVKSRATEMLRSFVAVRCNAQKRGACV